jgi:hypothetical protein
MHLSDWPPCSTPCAPSLHPWVLSGPCGVCCVLQARADSLAGEGLRVLALAMMEVPDTTRSVTTEDVLGGPPRLTLTCLVGIVDPPRAECTEAIARCHTAGVRVIMITGDSPLTAAAVGNWLGIETSEVLTGRQLEVGGPVTVSFWQPPAVLALRGA